MRRGVIESEKGKGREREREEGECKKKDQSDAAIRRRSLCLAAVFFEIYRRSG